MLEGQVAIITGAANGIGRGVAIEMAKMGADVVIADIDEAGSRKTQTLVEQYNHKSLVIPTDVRDDEQNTLLVDKVLAEFGKIDILVNNAGINTNGGILEISHQGALDVFKTNLLGPFFLTQRVAKEMVERDIRGSILFTSSIHSQTTQLHPAYSSSKAALEMFIRDTALELAQYGVRVNGIAPGAIAIRGQVDRTNTDVPLGYSGEPADIGKAMVFLASDMGKYITGQTLVVDGGLSLVHLYYLKGKKPQ